MKNLLTAFCLLFSVSAFGQCIPIDTSSVPGFYPHWDSLACFQRGIPGSVTMYYKNFETFNLPPTITIDSIIIDSILNVPCGITWLANKTSFAGPEAGCITFTGTTSDTAGSYSLQMYLTVWIAGPTPISRTNVQMGLPYYLQVTNGGACPAVDTANADAVSTCSSLFGYNTISGRVYYDANTNGTYDGGDYVMPHQAVSVSPLSTVSGTNAAGQYMVSVVSGTYQVAVVPLAHYAVSGTGSYTISFSALDSAVANKDFGLIATDTVHDVAISVTTAPARPGFATTHWITYTNLGTQAESGSLSYSYDTTLQYVSSSDVPAINQPGLLQWNYSNLLPFQSRTIQLGFSLAPDISLMGRVLYNTASIDSLSGTDEDLSNNTASIDQTVTASYDPNDKAVTPAAVTPAFLATDAPLQYRIRFQNTGTDTAFTIVVRDTLDDVMLDVATIKTTGASHPYSLTVEQGKYAVWTFNNILLPDSNRNEPRSHGFVSFNINLKNGLAAGQSVGNQAGIYFDFNPVVMTNNTIADFSTGLRDITASGIDVRVYPNPAGDKAYLVIDINEPVSVSLFDLSGKEVFSAQSASGQVEINTGNLVNGLYFYKLLMKNGASAAGKLAVQH